VRLPVAVAELLELGERLLARGEGVLMIAQLRAVVRDVVEGVGTPDLMAGGPVQVKR
jgi:hypothetical protein